MKISNLAASLTLLIAVLSSTSISAAERVRLDGPWRTATGIKPQSTSPDYDDHLWRTVTLPHDWSITYSPDSAANSGNDGGYLPGVLATYRHTLPVDSVLPGKYFLYLEGAYMNPEVWVNGEEVDSHSYGYTSFRVDVTDYLEDGDNSIVIVCDNSEQPNSRWYSGTGLYRPVWLEHYNPVYIEPRSMFVQTPGIRPGMAIGRLTANVNDSREDRDYPESYTATLTIVDPDGVALQPEVATFTLAADERTKPLLIDFPVPDPELWTPDTPKLYTATLSIEGPDGVTDENTVTFGLRTFDFDAEEGAFLNDHPIVLNGACVHHDNGILGAAAYEAAEWRKVQLLKRAGFNSVRTSHNPPSTAFLEACDRLGLLVIDEAFDGWREKKTPHDYGEVFESLWPVDLEALVLRDRNHPSVIAWSIGNEILERKSPWAVETAGQMVELAHHLDPTRPVTQALASWDADWEIYDPLAAQHDIIGYNYLIHKAESDHERVPERVIWQTESYPRDAFANYMAVRNLPYVIGDFVWTGIDYIGESGIGRYYYDGQVPGEHWERNIWPWHNATCGDIDITGLRKPISYYRDLLYNNLDTIYMAVQEPDGYRGTIKETGWSTYPTFESWNWPGHEGKPINVEIITRSPKVRLYLNDSIVATQDVNEGTEYKALIPVDFRPGTLRAVAIDANGKEGKSVQLTTADKPASIKISYERIPNTGTDYDLVFVDVALLDNNGNVNTLADNLLTFAISQDSQILGTGNADPTDPIGYTAKVRNAYHGRAAAVIKTPHLSSPTLTVTSHSLPTSTTILAK